VSKLKANDVKRVEYLLDGAIDKSGGANDRAGKKRGPYHIGGDSERTAQRKRQKMRAEMIETEEGGPKRDLQCCLDGTSQSTRAYQKDSASVQQTTLTSFFRVHPNPAWPSQQCSKGDNKMTVVEDDSDFEVLCDGSWHSHCDSGTMWQQSKSAAVSLAPMTRLENDDGRIGEGGDEVDEHEVNNEVEPEEAEQEPVDGVVLEAAEEAEAMSEWVNDVLGDAALTKPAELQVLACEGLKAADSLRFSKERRRQEDTILIIFVIGDVVRAAG